MVDNVSVTPGSGATIGADDVGGVLYQRTKTVWGPDGTVNDVDVASGKPLPVQMRSSTGLVLLGEPTDAKSTATDTTSASVIAVLKQLSASLQSIDAKLTTTVPYTETDYSGTITLGGTAQTVIAENLTRRGALIQNQSAADMYVNTTGTATITGDSEWLPPGSQWTTGSNTDAISVIGGTTGQVFAAKEW